MSQYINKIRTDQGDLQIDYNALANLPTISNPNLLINGDFRNPVNQRGQTAYTATNAKAIYTIDRWRTKGLTVTVNTGSITVSNTSEAVWGFVQMFEKTLPEDDYTLSLNVLSVTGSPYVKIEYTEGSESTAKGLNSVGVHSTTIHGTVYRVNIVLKQGDSLTLAWAKLERGTVVTPFAPRTYTEEFALCQRFYIKSNGIRLPVTMGTNNLFMQVPLPATMRGIPTVTFSKSNIVVVRDDSAESHNYVMGEHLVNLTDTHAILNIGGQYGVSTFKSGCVAEDFPFTLDAEIYY